MFLRCQQWRLLHAASTKSAYCGLFNTAAANSKMSSNPPFDFTDVFSPENKISSIQRIQNKVTGFKYQNMPMKKRAAVLIPLCYDLEGAPCFLYTLRSLKLSNHRGEICFPGGTADPEDGDDAVKTALRETQEELGIAAEDIDVWTIMTPMPTASSLMGVTPVVGFIKFPVDTARLHVNPDEVEKAFTISFAHLCDKSNWGHTQFRKGFGMPVYKNMKVYHPPELYSRPAGLSSSEDEEAPDVPRDVRLWGLTAILTHVVLEALAPQSYTRHIPMLKSSPSSSDASKL